MRCSRGVWRDDESADGGAAPIPKDANRRFRHRRCRLAERYQPDAIVSWLVLQRTNERRSRGDGGEGRMVDLDEQDFRASAIHNNRNLILPWAPRGLPERQQPHPASTL